MLLTSGLPPWKQELPSVMRKGRPSGFVAAWTMSNSPLAGILAALEQKLERHLGSAGGPSA